MLHFLAFLSLFASGTFVQSKKVRSELPKYEIHQSQYLPRDVQVSTFLHKEETKLLFYWSEQGVPISVTVTPCTSVIAWSVRHRMSNNTGAVVPGEKNLGEIIAKDLRTLNLTSSKGLYVIELKNPNKESYVHVYISTEPGGPQALRASQLMRLKLQKRRRRKRLTVHWSQSLVDPQATEYCLVVSTVKNYTTLCEAQGERFGVQPPYGINIKNIWKNDNKDLLVSCVGPRTQYTLSNLQQGQQYYFNLFAINLQTNLSYRLGYASTIFEKQVKPIILKDGKFAFTNLKKLDGKAVLKYKVGRGASDTLSIHLMPCGGSIEAEVLLKGTSVLPKRRIEGYGELQIKDPAIGQRYYIKLLSTDHEELRRTSGVQVLATSRPSLKSPIPNMPSETEIHEYVESKQCNSVTVGWIIPSTGQRVAHYCLSVKEGRLREWEGYKMSNQCNLDAKLKKRDDNTLTFCKDISQVEKKVITKTISPLKAGRNYVIQVTVKKPKGKTLSYDLLQVHTKPNCEQPNTTD